MLWQRLRRFPGPELWLLLLPYLALYLLWAAFGWPVTSLTSIFRGLNILLVLVVALKASPWLKTWRENWPVWAFFSALALLLYLPGAYLEFPSDPWEHFRRIYAWQGASTLRSEQTWMKFSYFWLWSWLKNVPILSRRTGLDIVSTLTQLYLAAQFYRVARKLGLDRNWSCLQALATFCLFGHNIFSFRYYALSSTAFSYVAFLDGTIRLLDVRQLGFSTLRKTLWFWPLLGIFLAFNHIQEVLLLAVVAIALTAEWFFSAKGPKIPVFRKSASLLGLFVGGWILGWGALHFTAPRELVFHLFKPHRLFPPFSGYLSKYGVFRLWSLRGPYFETLGLHGILAIVLAWLIRRKSPRISALVLTPIALLFFSPMVLALTSVTEMPNTYRILYAFPASFAWVEAARLAFKSERFSQFLRRTSFLPEGPAIPFALTAIFLVGMGSFPAHPWRGRLWFQLNVAHPLLAQKELDAVAQEWKNRGWGRPVFPFDADNITDFVLGTQLGFPPQQERTAPISLFTSADTKLNYSLSSLERFKRVCTLVIPVPSRLPPVIQSRVATLSGHWTSVMQNLALQVNGSKDQWIKQLPENGFTREELPPFYDVYFNQRCWAAPGIRQSPSPVPHRSP